VAYLKQNYFQRRTKPKGPRSNNRIHASEVQVIDSDGKNLGILPTRDAIEAAKEQGLDLIEISPKANPPVCKIVDMGKYRYDLQKKANKAKKKQKIVNLKEIKLRPGTETHDYNFKIKNSQKFLQKGDKVKFTIRFKGREMQHTDLGKELMNRIKKDVFEMGKVEAEPRLEGRQMVMIIQPL
jgi:translation initiation factor IF-3